MQGFVIGFCTGVLWVVPYVAFVLIKRAFSTPLSFSE